MKKYACVASRPCLQLLTPPPRARRHRLEAIALGQMLLRARILSHVLERHMFKDKHLFYSVNRAEVDRRVEQASNTNINSYQLNTHTSTNTNS